MGKTKIFTNNDFKKRLSTKEDIILGDMIIRELLEILKHKKEA